MGRHLRRYSVGWQQSSPRPWPGKSRPSCRRPARLLTGTTSTAFTTHSPLHQGRVAIHLPRERFGHLTTPSEAQQILSLIDWDFANACMVGHAAKRLEDIRRERKAAAVER